MHDAYLAYYNSILKKNNLSINIKHKLYLHNQLLCVIKRLKAVPTINEIIFPYKDKTRRQIIKCHWRRQWQPTPVLLPGKSHGWRSLVGCSPGGHKESDRTERLHFHFSLSRTGEGNGNPFQCSCLENPRDGGAWWAAVYGVTQNQTRLK